MWLDGTTAASTDQHAESLLVASCPSLPTAMHCDGPMKLADRMIIISCDEHGPTRRTRVMKAKFYK